jgi:hypothetical protein
VGDERLWEGDRAGREPAPPGSPPVVPVTRRRTGCGALSVTRSSVPPRSAPSTRGRAAAAGAAGARARVRRATAPLPLARVRRRRAVPFRRASAWNLAMILFGRSAAILSLEKRREGGGTAGTESPSLAALDGSTFPRARSRRHMSSRRGRDIGLGERLVDPEDERARRAPLLTTLRESGSLRPPGQADWMRPIV